jgi:phytoene synthase
LCIAWGRIVEDGSNEGAGSDLTRAYRRCAELHREHGRTYYLATRLLPHWKRRHVHALYGFARYADDIVDRVGAIDAATRARELTAWSAGFTAGLRGEPCDDEILPAVLHTIRVFDLDLVDFDKFLASMAMDLTVTGYQTYDDLLGYMEGSAAVIGTMKLPLLGVRRGADLAAAREPARQLGLAFQLTNFIRDVAADRARGRVYLPQEALDRFGVSRDDLAAPHAGPAVRWLVAHEIARAREHYRAAEPGVAMLATTSRPCIRAAFTLYSAILDEVERGWYDVLRARATVPTRRRLALLARDGLGAPGRALARSRRPAIAGPGW